MKHNYTDNQ